MPFPLHFRATNTQPSLGRVNVTTSGDLESLDASSRVDTRLFSFFSPERSGRDRAGSAMPHRRIREHSKILARMPKAVSSASGDSFVFLSSGVRVAPSIWVAEETIRNAMALSWPNVWVRA